MMFIEIEKKIVNWSKWKLRDWWYILEAVSILKSYGNMCILKNKHKQIQKNEIIKGHHDNKEIKKQGYYSDEYWFFFHISHIKCRIMIIHSAISLMHI